MIISIEEKNNPKRLSLKSAFSDRINITYTGRGPEKEYTTDFWNEGSKILNLSVQIYTLPNL